MSDDLSLLQAALIGYQHQLDQIEAKMAEIRGTLAGNSFGEAIAGLASQPAKRGMSEAGRRRIAAAQRKRWAAVNAGKQPAPKKRRISAAGRKRIADATRKRWAEYRAQKAAAK